MRRDPDRLLESSGSEVERLLLRAGRERAPRGAKRRAIAAATGVVAASTISGGSSAGSTAGAAVAGKAGASATALVSLKWIVVVGVASVGVAAGTAAVQTSRTESSASRVAKTAISVPAQARKPAGSSPLLSPPVVATVSVSAAPSVDPPAPLLPSAPPPVAAPLALTRASSPASKSRGVATDGSNAAAELAMLDQARGLIRGGEAARGLSLLEAYASRFPRGVMAPEASILRIEALVGAGDLNEAKREGEALLRANPESPYAPRIASLISSPSSP
jgi:hypothetical protein